MFVSDFKSKKLVEYLQPGMKVCLVFKHGLGDAVDFFPLYRKLVKNYPDVKFSLYTELGQDELFGKVSRDESDYDIVFEIAYKMSESIYNHTPTITKTGKCAAEELGVHWDKEDNEFFKLKDTKSPLIAVHFNSTCDPVKLNCSEELAHCIWTKIKEAGYIPLEVHFKHANHNSKNNKYGFIDNTVRGCKASITNLVGTLQACRGFIGVNSGPFHIAAQLYPDRCLYLRTGYDYKNYYQTRDILSNDNRTTLDLNVWETWLNRIK